MKHQWRLLVLLCLIGSLPLGAPAFADVHDPFDPFDQSAGISSEDDDKDKTPEELLLEADILMRQEKAIDARTKLLRVLQKDPKQYHAHMMLASYYLVEVGHFRLALKYAKQAEALFFEKNGRPPYYDSVRPQEHAHILYLLSQIRLNLDNYQGALDTLNEFNSYNYYASWYSGSRAWILMKLGQIDEAIKVAKLGVMSNIEVGRTLNMLGILYSMNGERDASLKVFKEAIAYELQLGSLGQPATPLNNSGEVYKEMFNEDQAENSWLKATSMPDGCEHVLPALNLSLLYIEELNLDGATKAMNNFESCVAQFPLRNGEEHRALVHLARGRIDLLSGKVDSALAHLEAAAQSRQWFGKIGTDQEDLEAGVTISLAQALRRKNNLLSFAKTNSYSDWFANMKERAANRMRSWWLMRRARQIMVEDLSNLEDIYIRNTDSMIEYPTFGEMLSGFPSSILERRIYAEESKDGRPDAVRYYQAYLAENYLKHGRQREGMALINEVLKSARPKFDNALKMHTLLLKLKYYDIGSADYTTLANEVFALSRAALRNYGFQLPVNYSIDRKAVIDELDDGPFYLDNSQHWQYSINYSLENDEHSLQFISGTGVIGNIRVKGNDLARVVSKLTESVFTEDQK